MQRRRLVGGLSLAVGVLVVTIGVVTTSIREPTYGGRPLSFWFVELESVRTPVQRRNTKLALGSILTNSPSSFASLVCAHESPVLRSVRKTAERYFGFELHSRAVRRRAIGMRVLEIMGDGAAPVVPDLVSFLTHRRSDVRYMAARALAVIGPGAQGAVPRLTMAILDTDEGLALRAVEALKSTGPPALEHSVPELQTVAMTTNRSREVRRACVQALAICGPSAVQAIPDLLQLSESGDEIIRSSSIRALGEVGPDRSDLLAPVIAALDDSSTVVREAAINAIEKMAPTSIDAITALKRIAIQDVKTQLCDQAVGVIEALDPPLELVLDTLIQVWRARARSNSLGVRIPRMIRRGGAQSVEALIPYLEDPNQVFVGQVLGFLGDLGSEAGLAVESIRRMLGDRRPESRRVTYSSSQ